jgi:hypothetical protein
MLRNSLRKPVKQTSKLFYGTTHKITLIHHRYDVIIDELSAGRGAPVII